uniref:Protein kinase domain-containing protein n=1 Tax=Syphacia muris TaxID=451379 RepID=A0A0N5A9I1_9BILA
MEFDDDSGATLNSKSGSFEVLDTIGRGSFGIVLKAKKVETGEIVAIKRIHIKNGRKSEMQIVREMMILKNVKHKNIVKLIDVLRDLRAICLVLELAETSLKAIIDDTCNYLDENFARGYLYQILEGVSYLHSLKIMHRDLKPGNILVFTDGVLKLTDFGQACYYFENDPGMTYENQVASRWYRAPELLFGSIRYTPKVDIWSCGCILAEFYSRKPIFQGKNDIDQISCIFSMLGSPTEENWKAFNELPDSNKLLFNERSPMDDWSKTVPGISKKGESLLRKMLVCDPSERILSADALNDEFLSDVFVNQCSFVTSCIDFNCDSTVLSYHNTSNSDNIFMMLYELLQPRLVLIFAMDSVV